MVGGDDGGIFVISCGVSGDLELDRTPVGSVKDGSWTDVKEDDGVSRTKVILNGPSDGESALVA